MPPTSIKRNKNLWQNEFRCNQSFQSIDHLCFVLELLQVIRNCKSKLGLQNAQKNIRQRNIFLRDLKILHCKAYVSYKVVKNISQKIEWYVLGDETQHAFLRKIAGRKDLFLALFANFKQH